MLKQQQGKSEEQVLVKNLLASMPDGVVLINNQRRVILVNPAFIEMSRLKQVKLSLNGLIKLFSKENPHFESKINKALKSKEAVKIKEAALERQIYEIFIVPLYAGRNNISGRALIFHDITHIKEIDRMKTEFVSIASHQLRTPLTAIKLFVEMLVEGEVGPLNKKQAEYLDHIQHSSERMVKLINDLLNISRLEVGTLSIIPEPTQLADFIEEIINDLGPLSKSYNCRIVFKKPVSALPRIPIDRTLLRQIVHNLLINAVQYAPPQRSTILVDLRRANGDFLFKVQDQGIGIPKKEQSRIFEKFFRADNARKAVAEGSGLGLYISRMIIENIGGRIWFESKGKNKGASFHLIIPQKGMKLKQGKKGLAY